MKNLLKPAIATVIAFAVAAGLAALAWRLYAPGGLDERLNRAGARWSPFAHWQTWRFLGIGLTITLRLAVVSVALSAVFGVGLAIVRLGRHRHLEAPAPLRLVRAPLIVVIEAVRSSPLFMLVLYTFIGLPVIGVAVSPFWTGVIALTLYTSCVLSEIVRAGILSLDHGQFEAAAAMGLLWRQRLSQVVLPQALRRMIPAIVSQLVTLIKDTSLVSAITIVELTRRGQILAQFSANVIETYLVVMAIYFVINFALSQAASRLEARPGLVGRAPAPVTIGQEDQVRSTA